MRCETTSAPDLPRINAGPPNVAEQLKRLITVYRSAGMNARAARKAARADLDSFASGSLDSTEPVAPPTWLVLAAFAAVYLIWGSTFLAIRFAVTSLPPFLMAGSRFLVAGLLLYGFAMLRGAQPPTSRQWAHAGIVGACLLVVGNGGVTWAEQFIPSGVAALMIALTPLWMVIFDWMLPSGVRPKPLVFAGLAVGFAGVSLLVPAFTGGSGYGWGIVALVAASMCWAAGSLFNRRAQKPSSPLLAVAIQMIAGGVLLGVLGLAVGEAGRFSASHVTSESVWAWIYLCLAGSLIGYTAYVWLLQVSTPARVSTYAYVNPLIAVALGCTIGKEPFSGELLLAAGLIVVAVGLIVRGGVQHGKTVTTK